MPQSALPPQLTAAVRSHPTQAQPTNGVVIMPSIMTQPAELLLPRIAEGDQSAVRECLTRYGGLVWSLARRFHANSADAEDAVQEIFVEIWKSAARYDASVATEGTFITMIARRRLIDSRRRQSRQMNSVPLPDTVLNPGHEVDHAASTADEVALATRALACLREEQQQLLRLSIYQGLSHEEIATQTGLPLGTVKTHIRRGLLKVRDLLNVSRDEADL